MSTLKAEQTEGRAQHVKVTADTLTVDLTDGRTISVPLAWFPRLVHGSVAERNNWRFIARGEGIHWIDLDEDDSGDRHFPARPLPSSFPFAQGARREHRHCIR